MDTPKYIMEAVQQLVDRDEPGYLIQMFLNGIPLHEYPETRLLIAQIMWGERIRPTGRPLKTQKAKANDKQMIALVAQMVAVGYPLISNGLNKARKLSVCEIVGKHFGVKKSQVYKVYKNEEKSDFVAQNKAIAAKFLTKEDFQDWFI
jgi:hypothetical protein